MPDPLVSVIIITYNHENYIRVSIEGCIEQKTNFPYEIIIHDDSSTDNTANIVKEYAEKYPDLIVPILQTENQYSKGEEIIAKIIVTKARGKYVAFCEGDDFWIDQYKLQKQIKIMENDPFISLCFTASKWVYVDGSNKEKIMKYFSSNHYLKEKDVIMKGGGVTDLASTVIKRDIFLSLPEWYHLSPVGDVALYLLAIAHGRIFYLNELTAVYHRGVKNSWTQLNKQNIDHQITYLKKLIRMKDVFDEQTDYRFHSFIKKRNNLDIIDFSFITKDYPEFKKKYFPRLTLFEKIEYYLFRLLRSRLLWHRYHKILRILGGN